MVDEGVPEGTEFVWLQAEQRLEAQIKQADALDLKAGTLVGLHALGAGLAATVVGRLSAAGRWVAVFVIAGLLVGGLLALAAYAVQAYERGPGPRDLWQFGAWPAQQIEYRFLSLRFDALDANRQALSSKARRITWSVRILAVLAFVMSPGAVGIDVVRTRTGAPKLPAPPPHGEDLVGDVGWLSRRLSRRYKEAAHAEIARTTVPSEEAGLPPDPPEAPPLPSPPPSRPDPDERGSRPGQTK
ncbi:MAG: hypothetical protein ACJ77A_01380 [Actinomycetota bacterium]